MREQLPFGAMAELGPEQNTGLLWAINRHFLHPRGYALAFHYQARCPECGAERADYEFAEARHLERCPNCHSDAVPLEALTGWSIIGNGTECFAYAEEMDDEGFRLFETFLSTLPIEEESDEARADADPAS